MSGQEFGVQHVFPPRLRGEPGPYGEVQVFATRAQADYHAEIFNPDTYQILVRDVSEWRVS